MKSSSKKIAWSFLPLVLAWGMLCWFVADGNYRSHVEDLIRQEGALSQQKADDLADSLYRNLHYLGGIPEVFSHALRTRHSVALFGSGATPSLLPYETRRRRWIENTVLSDLNQYLAFAQGSINVDLVFVLNAAGDCIAASNWDKPESPIGTSYAGRAYFEKNRRGQRGVQYATGKTTHIPGLYFSSPIFVDGKFMGAVVAKASVPNLSFLLKLTDAFIVDANGVIILAHDKWKEMRALPHAHVFGMREEERNDLYQRSQFDELIIESSTDTEHPSVLFIQGESFPHLLATKELPEYGLKIFIENHLPQFFLLKEGRLEYFLLLLASGGVLFLFAGGVLLYLRAIGQSKEALVREGRLNELLLQVSGEGIHLLDQQGRVVLANDTFCRMLGYAREELLGMHVSQWDVRFQGDELKNSMASVFEAGGRMIETRHRRRDGSEFDVEINVVTVEFGGKKLLYNSARDISERKRTEESMKMAALIYESSSEAIMVTDENNLIMDVNQAFSRITGYSKEDVLGKNPKVLQSGRHDKAFYHQMWQSLANDSHWQGELWDRRKNGEIYTKWANISVIHHADGSVYRYVAQFSDITEKKQKDQLIWKQANFDALTGLPNRSLFYDRLDQGIKKAQRSGQALALLFIDLDRFKEINDSLGHAKGDILLMEAANRIRLCVRVSDTVARLGGDEFTVILPEFGGRLHLERLAQDIIQELVAPFDLGGGDMGYISASIGITIYPDDAQDVESLLKHADQAMYVAKAEGRNRFGYFTPSMQQEAREKLALTGDLRRALERRELQVYYQPIVDLERGNIVKAEALLRWKHPKRGMVSPATFIPLAEESGLILEIGEWVFEEAIASIEHWHRKIGRVIQVSVNRSPVQFGGEATHMVWMNKLENMGLPGNSLSVEITEGLLIKDSPKVKGQLLEFRNQGIEVSIDDFGTGFSSLSYLKQFDIDYLKIDRSFTSNLIDDESDRALTEAIIVMAHKLGIKTIAEGVETEGQRDLLRAFGCDYVQGFLYSPAVSADEFGKLLEIL